MERLRFISVSRRIEIEITSLNGDVATWRAAGAKLPKGTLSAALVQGGAVVGNVYRADVENYMDGIEVISVLPPKTASPLDPRNEKLEIIVKPASGPDVVVTYAPKGRGGRRDGERREGDRKDSKRSSSRPGSKDRGGAPTGEKSERGPRTERPASGARPARSDRPARPSGARTGGPVVAPLTTIYRNALLATLSPEQLPVAEQLLRGGIPAVRSAVAEQNKNATAQGRPTIDAETIDRIAEELLGKTNLALWKDKAAGAIGAGRELRLRDLRAVVTSAKTVSLDDEGRQQLKELQTALTSKVDHLRTVWNEKLETALNSKNVAETLRLVARPPDMSTRVSAEMAAKVVTMTSETLTADLDAAAWNEIVTLAVDTSIRRNIKPVGIPANDVSKALAIKNAGAIPELAKLLGMPVPPPPPPSRAPRRPANRRAS